jgi:hypothetical protein
MCGSVAEPYDTGGCATLISDTSSGRLPSRLGRGSCGCCRNVPFCDTAVAPRWVVREMLQLMDAIVRAVRWFSSGGRGGSRSAACRVSLSEMAGARLGSGAGITFQGAHRGVSGTGPAAAAGWCQPGRGQRPSWPARLHGGVGWSGRGHAGPRRRRRRPEVSPHHLAVERLPPSGTPPWCRSKRGQLERPTRPRQPWPGRHGRAVVAANGRFAATTPRSVDS